MTPKRRFIIAVTVLSFLTVTGFVVGCDSDDTPTVTAPSGGGGTTPTRSTTAEQQGREGLEETDNGTMVRNTGDVALNVRFNYDEAKHYRLNPETTMPADPTNAGSAPTRVACGVPATGRANGQCFTNDGVTAPVPYEAPSEPGGSDPPSEPPSGARWDASLIARDCVQISDREDDEGLRQFYVRNTCEREIIVKTACPHPSSRLNVVGGRVDVNPPAYDAFNDIYRLPAGSTERRVSSSCPLRLIAIACYRIEEYIVNPYWLSYIENLNYSCVKRPPDPFDGA